jgi:hypothetical protein
MSTWPERVAKALEEGALFVTPEEFEMLVEVFGPGGSGFTGGMEVHLNGLPVMVDPAQAERQATVVPRCLCVTFESVAGIEETSSRLCSIHGPDSAHQRLTEGRRRLAEDVKREALARMRPET